MSEMLPKPGKLETEKSNQKRRPGGGRKPKGDNPYAKNIMLALSAEDDHSLSAFAALDRQENETTVTKQDLIRTAIRRYLIYRSPSPSEPVRIETGRPGTGPAG